MSKVDAPWKRSFCLSELNALPTCQKVEQDKRHCIKDKAGLQESIIRHYSLMPRITTSASNQKSCEARHYLPDTAIALNYEYKQSRMQEGSAASVQPHPPSSEQKVALRKPTLEKPVCLGSAWFTEPRQEQFACIIHMHCHGQRLLASPTARETQSSSLELGH